MNDFAHAVPDVRPEKLGERGMTWGGGRFVGHLNGSVVKSISSQIRCPQNVLMTLARNAVCKLLH